MILALVVGCGVECGEGETLTRDGCVPAAQSAGWDEETLPGYRLRECLANASGTGDLDFEQSCIKGACIGDSYASFVTRLGAPTDVDGLGSSVSVDWEQHAMYAYFPDDDGDNLPDDGGPPDRFVVDGPAAGSSVDGLATEISLACFVQVLGPPDDVDTENGEVQSLWYDALDIRVSDYSGSQTTLTDPDGYVDVISFGDRL